MDGFEDHYWNLTQLVGWVYLGDRQFVRDAADGSNRSSSYWQEMVLPDGRKELVETRSSPPNERHMSIIAAIKGAAYASFEAAEYDVLAALKDGKLQATGLENGKGNPKPVPQIQWPWLEFDWSEPPHAAPKSRFRDNATYWCDLKFRRSEVLELWPDPLQHSVDADYSQAVVDPCIASRVPEPRRPGRPSRRTEIVAAYEELRDADEIDFDAPLNSLYGRICKKVSDGDNADLKGLGDEAIRNAISPLFREDKIKAKAKQ